MGETRCGSGILQTAHDSDATDANLEKFVSTVNVTVETLLKTKEPMMN